MPKYYLLAGDTNQVFIFFSLHKIKMTYFLIPSLNKYNLIYLQSSEWRKHNKNNKFQVVASCEWCRAQLCILARFFLHHLKPETNNKALIQKQHSTLT